MKNPLWILTLFLFSIHTFASESPQEDEGESVEIPLTEFLQALVGGQAEEPSTSDESSSDSKRSEASESEEDTPVLNVHLLSFDKEEVPVHYWGEPPSSIKEIKKFLYFLENSDHFFDHFPEPQTLPLLIVGPESSGKKSLAHRIAKELKQPLREINCEKVSKLRTKLLNTLNSLAEEISEEEKSLLLLRNFPLKFDLHAIFKELEDPSLCKKIFIISTSSDSQIEEDEKESRDLNLKRLESTGKSLVFENPEPNLVVKGKIVTHLLAERKVEITEEAVSNVIQESTNKSDKYFDQKFIQQLVHGTTVKYFLDPSDDKSPLIHLEETFRSLKRYALRKRKRSEASDSHLSMYL